MKGTLYKTEKGWEVISIQATLNGPLLQSIPLHPDDLDSDIIRWANNGSLDNKEVEFEVITIAEGTSEFDVVDIDVAKLK